MQSQKRDQSTFPYYYHHVALSNHCRNPCHTGSYLPHPVACAPRQILLHDKNHANKVDMFVIFHPPGPYFNTLKHVLMIHDISTTNADRRSGPIKHDSDPFDFMRPLLQVPFFGRCSVECFHGHAIAKIYEGCRTTFRSLQEELGARNLTG